MYAGSSVCSFLITTAVTVSFVWLDSISAISECNLWSFGEAFLSASRSQPIVSTAAP